MEEQKKNQGGPDVWTVVALALMAMAITDFIHEGLGHGGACLATGGRALVLSTVHFDCSADNRIVDAGGTLANLVAAVLCWGLMRGMRRRARARYFFWLMMTFNLLDAAGYFLFSGIGNIGDWAGVVAGWHPAWAWRVGLTALGTVTYFLWFVPLCLRELKPFLPAERDERWRRARQLTMTPYFAQGVLMCVAGALNPVGPMLVLISAAAASFGGNSGLAWMWNLLKGERQASEQQMPELTRSWPAIIAAAVVAAVFIAGLGPGVKFR